MNFISASKISVLAAFGLFIAIGASAQLAPPTQTLDPTIKVHPAPTVEIEKPVVAVPSRCVCTAQFDPVCARTTDGRKSTYSNACRARCEGATVLARGKC